MNKKILIDASYPEETRVAVVTDGILQSIDRDALAVNKLKGNVYLARVTRVEPSLQAAFVDYGGNRHGFLPFGDISPEYYQVSEEEKLALMGVSLESIIAFNQRQEQVVVSQVSEEEGESGEAIVAFPESEDLELPKRSLFKQDATEASIKTDSTQSSSSVATTIKVDDGLLGDETVVSTPVESEETTTFQSTTEVTHNLNEKSKRENSQQSFPIDQYLDI